MIRTLFLITLFAFSFKSQAQNLGLKLDKAVERVYAQYKLFFDSSLLDKHVLLDTKKSYLVNSQTQKIKTLAIADDTFVFDEFSLLFAVVYKGDTITQLPPCRLDTFQNLMALGTPSNPIQHGDVLPPYLQLVKGKIKFDYKNLQKLLKKMQIETTGVVLKKQAAAKGENINKKDSTGYRWIVTTTCPEINCPLLQISASTGKIIPNK